MAPLYLRQLLLGPMENFVYLVGPADSKETWVVDPAWDVPAIERAAEADGRVISGIFTSHHHGDHINGVEELLSRHDVPVYAQREEIDFSPTIRRWKDALRPMSAGDAVSVGGIPFKALHTPGHTPGSQCLLVGDVLVSGDTAFIGGCGRCDLPGGDPEAMFRSLTQTLGKLPDDTRLFPGHDYADRPSSTIADERAHNPYFQYADLASFLRFRMQGRR